MDDTAVRPGDMSLFHCHGFLLVFIVACIVELCTAGAQMFAKKHKLPVPCRKVQKWTPAFPVDHNEEVVTSTLVDPIVYSTAFLKSMMPAETSVGYGVSTWFLVFFFAVQFLRLLYYYVNLSG